MTEIAASVQARGPAPLMLLAMGGQTRSFQLWQWVG
jgi:hypothetical protein